MKTLPAITAEIENDFKEEFGHLISSCHTHHADVSAFLRAALRKVAEEMQTAVMPEEGHNQEKHLVVAGWNAARDKMQENFKTFINQ